INKRQQFCCGFLREPGWISAAVNRDSAFRQNRKMDGEGRAASRLRLYPDASAMQTSDASYRWKSETGAALGGGEEWVEDAFQIFSTNAMTVIGIFDYCIIGRFFGGYIFKAPDSYRNLAFVFEGFDSIDNEVKHGIFQRRRIRGEHYVVQWRVKFNLNSICKSSAG